MEVLVKGTSEKVILLLKEIVKENRTTLVMVTHDREIATTCTDRVIELVDGKINRDLFAGRQGRDKIKRDLGHLVCSLDVEAESEDTERLDPGE